MICNLSHVRQSRQLSRRQLAELVGVSKEAIRLLEVGARTPSVRTAYRIADALGVPVDQIWPKPRGDDTRATDAS